MAPFSLTLYNGAFSLIFHWAAKRVKHHKLQCAMERKGLLLFDMPTMGVAFQVEKGPVVRILRHHLVIILLGQKDSFLRFRLVWSWQVVDKMPLHSFFLKKKVLFAVLVEVLDSICWGPTSGLWERIYSWPSLDQVYTPGLTMPIKRVLSWVLSAVYVCLDFNPVRPLDTLILDNQWIMKASCEHPPTSLLTTDLSYLFPTCFCFLLVPV